MSTNSLVGTAGEDLAALFLERHGLCIIARNTFVGADEIDIVAGDGSSIVAVEVKSSSNGDDPMEALDERKFTRFVRAAQGYRRPIGRLDVIAVSFEEERVAIRWLQGVR